MINEMKNVFKKKKFMYYFIIWLILHAFTFMILNKLYDISGYENANKFYEIKNVIKIHYSIIFYIVYFAISILVLIPIKMIFAIKNISLKD